MILRTKHNKKWECLEIEELDDGAALGHCRPDTRQIIISKKSKDKWRVFLHEAIHAINFDYEIGLTENQTLKLEDALIRVMKLNRVYEFWKKMSD